VKSQLALSSIVNLPTTRGGIIMGTDLLRVFLSGRNERTVKAYSQDLADLQAFVRAPTVDGAAKALLASRCRSLRRGGYSDSATLE
jgi:hypothetical protein